MYGKDYTNINYHKQYPSKLKHFHNWGIGAADKVVYPPGTVPQVRKINIFLFFILINDI